MSIDPDVAKAQTLPAHLYRTPEAHQAAIDGVFARSWHYLSSVEEAPERGEARPLVLGEGSLDEPVLLTRDEQGELHLLSNVCTHRGMVMLDAPCRARNIRCGYHGRRFALDGRLVAAPGFEGARDFPGVQDDLPRVSLARWGPLLFGSLEPEVEFEDWIRPVQERLSFYAPQRMKAAPERGRIFEVAAPWAAYCDNYLEGMHIPYVHPGLAAALDIGAYRVELFEQVSLQIGEAKAAPDAFALPPGHADAGARIGGYYYFCFPNLMLNFYPWGLSLNVVEPRGSEACRVRFLAFVAEPDRLEGGAGADLVTVELEDEAVVERVARGLRARLYTRGRYAPEHEVAVHHFHRLLAARLGADDGP